MSKISRIALKSIIMELGEKFHDKTKGKYVTDDIIDDGYEKVYIKHFINPLIKKIQFIIDEKNQRD